LAISLRRPIFRFESKERIGRDLANLHFEHRSSMETTMTEIIRFAWGDCPLGDFIIAMSDKGLVVLDFSSNRLMTEEELRSRFPKADLIHSQQELAGIIEKVKLTIEEPGSDSAIPLDLRGTPFEVEVWSMLRAIPVGETTSYGALAAKLGTRDARDVTNAIASNPIAILVPCHRVIKKDGSISGYRWGVARKRKLLAREQHSEDLPGQLFSAFEHRNRRK
jgi:AraC family transcriptional regulator of adaptative response/methylated-DNA-[protein]-cysteine methyltransferase